MQKKMSAEARKLRRYRATLKARVQMSKYGSAAVGFCLIPLGSAVFVLTQWDYLEISFFPPIALVLGGLVLSFLLYAIVGVQKCPRCKAPLPDPKFTADPETCPSCDLSTRAHHTDNR